MKKLLGILGVCCIIFSAAFIGGCGSKDDPVPASVAKPTDPNAKGDRNTPTGSTPNVLGGPAATK